MNILQTTLLLDRENALLSPGCLPVLTPPLDPYCSWGRFVVVGFGKFDLLN